MGIVRIFVVSEDEKNVDANTLNANTSPMDMIPEFDKFVLNYDHISVDLLSGKFYDGWYFCGYSFASRKINSDFVWVVKMIDNPTDSDASEFARKVYDGIVFADGCGPVPSVLDVEICKRGVAIRTTIPCEKFDLLMAEDASSNARTHRCIH